MRKLGYLVVEGPHDVELAARMLGACDQFTRVREYEALERPFKGLVPTAFPHKGDLQRRVPVPLFLQSATHGVALQCAEGDSNLANCLRGTLEILPPTSFDAIGALLDADSSETPAERFNTLVSELSDIGLNWPAGPGIVRHDSPRTGVYVLPDNAAAGTLEDLLIECGEVVYPRQMEAAREFIDAVMPHCPRRDFRLLHRNSGQKKALVGAVATLLKPGRAIQNSIQDNEWLNTEAQKLARIEQLRAFFADLFSL